VNYVFRPIFKWPRPFTRNRRRSPFAAGYSSTMKQLDRELSILSARNVVIQMALSDAEIRLDGRPRASAIPDHPGVILTFEKPVPPGKSPTGKAYNQTLNFPCDTYTTWQDNLRAITLALDALRRVDRYGVTNFEEQYRGWAQLPPGEGEQRRGPIVTPTMTVEAAARFVAEANSHDYPPQIIIASVDNFRGAYRTAAMKLHPDTNGGKESDQWHQLQAAADVLKAHHRL
jgi:hypothetical protein